LRQVEEAQGASRRKKQKKQKQKQKQKKCGRSQSEMNILFHLPSIRQRMNYSTIREGAFSAHESLAPQSHIE